MNDVRGFVDPKMRQAVAEAGAAAIAMHMKGEPRTMQDAPEYADVVREVAAFLNERAAEAEEAGVRSVMIDPGIGFGKSASGNLRILRELPTLREVGRPILIGASRKSFIGASLDLPVTERLEASLGVASLAAWQGAHLVRVHDVRETVRAVRMIDAVRGAC